MFFKSLFQFSVNLIVLILIFSNMLSNFQKKCFFFFNKQLDFSFSLRILLSFWSLPKKVLADSCIWNKQWLAFSPRWAYKENMKYFFFCMKYIFGEVKLFQALVTLSKTLHSCSCFNTKLKSSLNNYFLCLWNLFWQFLTFFFFFFRFLQIISRQ